MKRIRRVVISGVLLFMAVGTLSVFVLAGNPPAAVVSWVFIVVWARMFYVEVTGGGAR